MLTLLVDLFLHFLLEFLLVLLELLSCPELQQTIKSFAIISAPCLLAFSDLSLSLLFYNSLPLRGPAKQNKQNLTDFG